MNVVNLNESIDITVDAVVMYEVFLDVNTAQSIVGGCNCLIFGDYYRCITPHIGVGRQTLSFVKI